MSLESIVKESGFAEVDVDVRCPTLGAALARLRSADAILINRGAHERAICHRLAVYIECEIDRDRDDRSRWDVDCEYNLFGSDPDGRVAERTVEELRKRILVQGRCEPAGDESDHSVFPDIVVHHRDERDNELVLEVKVLREAPNKRAIEFDLRKLNAYSAVDGGLAYRHALFVVITPAQDHASAQIDVFGHEEGPTDRA